MNRLQKTYQIYLEIKKVLGSSFPSNELLKSADLLIETVVDNDPITADQMQGFWEPFTEKGVDELMADDGWMLLSQEDDWIYRVDEAEIAELHARILLNDYYGLKVAA